MMENRSFDHTLGYLSLAPHNRPVGGQSLDPTWLSKAENPDAGGPFRPFHSTDPYYPPPQFDPPHGRAAIKRHLGALFSMNGFVSALLDNISTDPDVRKLVMAYFGADEV